jgi:uncharacterized protein YgiM (DUF1202 family)
MNQLLRVSVAFGFLCFAASGALATDAIVKRHATLRADPSTENPPTATLQAGEDVELVEPSPKSGYYHVRTAEGETLTGRQRTAGPCQEPTHAPQTVCPFP